MGFVAMPIHMWDRLVRRTLLITIFSMKKIEVTNFIFDCFNKKINREKKKKTKVNLIVCSFYDRKVVYGKDTLTFRYGF
jgi:hypothetical protein